MCVSKHQSIGAEVVTHYLGSNMPTLEDHDDDDSDDELLEMHNYHVDFLLPYPPFNATSTFQIQSFQYFIKKKFSTVHGISEIS